MNGGGPDGRGGVFASGQVISRLRRRRETTRRAGIRSGPLGTRDDQPFLAVFLAAFAFAGMEEVKASDRATHSSALVVFLCHDAGIIT